MDITVSYLAILGAGVLSMILGALWYSPYLFGNVWARLSGMSEEKMKQAKSRGMKKLYVTNFVATLIMAFVLAHFAKIWGAQGISGAWQLAFWVWLGFIATTALGSILWEGKPIRLYFINIAYHLVSLFAMTIILVMWG